MERRPDQLRELGETLAFLKQPEPPGGWREALEMLQACNTGHDGSLSTVHANGPDDALARIETLALCSEIALPLLDAMRPAISRAADSVAPPRRMVCIGVPFGFDPTVFVPVNTGREYTLTSIVPSSSTILVAVRYI